jgi:peptidyl-prolyl cis-trans isomerase B (cyclophilin B)
MNRAANLTTRKLARAAAWLTACGALVLSTAPAIADRTNPDFVPPEITLPMGGGMTQPQAAPPSQPAPGQVVPGQTGQGVPGMQQGYPGFQMPNQMGGVPGLGGSQVNPFLMKGADRLRQPPGTQFQSKGMSAPGTMAGAPPAGSSAYMNSPPPVTPGNPMPPGGQPANLSTQARMADPTAVIATSKGNINIMLFRQYAPQTVAAFSQMVKSGFYNGLTFHRVEPGFVIQGGCPNGNGTGNYVPPGQYQPRFLPLEVSPKVSHNAAGVVAMAHMPGNVNSASCQFYITLKPHTSLDNQYTIFGGVTSGMEVVQSITKGDRILSITVSE